MVALLFRSFIYVSSTFTLKQTNTGVPAITISATSGVRPVWHLSDFPPHHQQAAIAACIIYANGDLAHIFTGRSGQP